MAAIGLLEAPLGYTRAYVPYYYCPEPAPRCAPRIQAVQTRVPVSSVAMHHTREYHVWMKELPTPQAPSRRVIHVPLRMTERDMRPSSEPSGALRPVHSSPSVHDYDDVAVGERRHQVQLDERRGSVVYEEEATDEDWDWDASDPEPTRSNNDLGLSSQGLWPSRGPRHHEGKRRTEVHGERSSDALPRVRFVHLQGDDVVVQLTGSRAYALELRTREADLLIDQSSPSCVSMSAFRCHVHLPHADSRVLAVRVRALPSKEAHVRAATRRRHTHDPYMWSPWHPVGACKFAVSDRPDERRCMHASRGDPAWQWRPRHILTGVVRSSVRADAASQGGDITCAEGYVAPAYGDEGKARGGGGRAPWRPEMYGGDEPYFGQTEASADAGTPGPGQYDTPRFMQFGGGARHTRESHTRGRLIGANTHSTCTRRGPRRHHATAESTRMRRQRMQRQHTSSSARSARAQRLNVCRTLTLPWAHL